MKKDTMLMLAATVLVAAYFYQKSQQAKQPPALPTPQPDYTGMMGVKGYAPDVW